MKSTFVGIIVHMSIFLVLVIGLIVSLLLIALSGIRTIDQASVGVITMFGKYRRAVRPGLNFIIPFFERVHSKVLVQNQTRQLSFAAITNDQASVRFTATVIFAVSDSDEETVKNVAFKFVDNQSFEIALNSAMEASVRSFVATKRQDEVLGLRSEIVEHSRTSLENQLASWGYTLQDLTVNDIQFDDAIMRSMSRVVVAKNEKTAAEFEGDALLIKRTKEAEAEGAAVRINAENQAEAARLRGEGAAMFRKAITVGLSDAADTLSSNNISPDYLAFMMWTETMRDVAKEGSGNVLFFDGSTNGMAQTQKQLLALTAVNQQDDNLGSVSGPQQGFVKQTHEKPRAVSASDGQNDAHGSTHVNKPAPSSQSPAVPPAQSDNQVRRHPYPPS